MTLRDDFLRRAGLEEPALTQIVNAIKAMPHGRPRERSARGVVEDWRGTCSTKLLLLRAVCPEVPMRFYNRVFRMTPEAAREHLGAEVATVVPAEGMIDVHTFARIGDQQTLVDVAFPGEPWDGRSDMTIVWGDGDDYEADGDPIAHKEELVRRFGDAAVRERLIRAIS